MAMASAFESVALGPALFYMGGELDMSARAMAEDALADAAIDGGLITIDMSNVTFLDSTGLRVLLHALGSMPSGCIVLHGVSRTVHHVLEISGVTLYERLHVVPCEEDPFPDSDRSGRGIDAATCERLQAMKSRHQELQARTERMRLRTERLVGSVSRTWERSREQREAARRSRRLAA